MSCIHHRSWCGSTSAGPTHALTRIEGSLRPVMGRDLSSSPTSGPCQRSLQWAVVRRDFEAAPYKWKGTKLERAGLGVLQMSQRDLVWIVIGALVIGAAGTGAFVVATYALSLF